MPDERSQAGRVSDAMSSRGLAGKRDYVRSLEQRGDDEALGLLVQCLRDESGYLRELAEAALLKLGERCGPALLPLLGQGLWFSRCSAARVLGRIGFRPAAGPLLALASDGVETVAREAYASLSALGQRGGSARIAWELHRLSPERRHGRLVRLAATDRALADRIERLALAEELMAQTDPDALRDDAPWVRASEEGVEWKLLNAPPPVKPATPATPPGPQTSPGADPSER